MARIRSLWCASLALTLACSLSGCWLGGAYERTQGKPVASEYKGLAGHTAVIVVYVPDGLVNNYPRAAREVMDFFRVELLKGVPNVRLVSLDRVEDWQRSTDWIKLSDKDVANHFGVDRVIRIEMVEYRTKEPGVEGYVKGRINANCRVVEVVKGETPRIGWERRGITAEWPTESNMEMLRINENVVRMRTLEMFAQTLAKAFYDHNELTPSMESRRPQRGTE
jgi:hypothetical protein